MHADFLRLTFCFPFWPRYRTISNASTIKLISDRIIILQHAISLKQLFCIHWSEKLERILDGEQVHLLRRRHIPPHEHKSNTPPAEEAYKYCTSCGGGIYIYIYATGSHTTTHSSTARSSYEPAPMSEDEVDSPASVGRTPTCSACSPADDGKDDDIAAPGTDKDLNEDEDKKGSDGDDKNKDGDKKDHDGDEDKKGPDGDKKDSDGKDKDGDKKEPDVDCKDKDVDENQPDPDDKDKDGDKKGPGGGGSDKEGKEKEPGGDTTDQSKKGFFFADHNPSSHHPHLPRAK